MDDCGHGPLTPDLEAEVARVAMKQGDLRHAAHHVAGALSADPLREDYLTLFQNLVEHAGAEAADVLELEDGAWWGRVAVHARYLAHLGQTDGATVVLCRIAAGFPGVPYLAWARSWPTPGVEAAEASFRALMQTHDLATWQLALACFGDRALEAHPNSPELAWLGSIGARRADDPTASLRWARQSVAAEPTWMGFAMLASAHKAAGDWPATIAAWERALTLDERDVSVLLDWGDSLVDRGDLDEAEARYRQALGRDPDNDWATGSLEVLAFLRDPSTAAWVRLAKWARDHDNRRAEDVVANHSAWMGWLPNPSEATADALRQIEGRDVNQGTITVSHLEGASVQHALAQLGDFELTATEIPPEDPRVPLFDAPFALWRWEGTKPVPAVGPPSDPEVSALVQRLASYRYDRVQWFDFARERVLALSPEQVSELKSLVVHPPSRHPALPAASWLWRVQHAVAYLLVALPGWSEELPHTRALRSMLAVRNDWLATAAIAAVTARAEREPDFMETALDFVLTVLKYPCTEGYWATATPAWWALLRLDLDDELGLHSRAFDWIDDDD